MRLIAGPLRSADARRATSLLAFVLAVVASGAGCHRPTRGDDVAGTGPAGSASPSGGVVEATEPRASGGAVGGPIGEGELRPRKPRRRPSGEAPRLSCRAAQSIIADVRARMAAPPTLPTEGAESQSLDQSLAESLVEWSDPHGLWTAAPDTTPGAVLAARAHALRAALEGRTDCQAAVAPVGVALAKWAGELEAAYAAGAEKPQEKWLEAASATAFEDGAIKTPALVLARKLGARAAAIAKHWPALAPSVELGHRRWVPRFDEAAWSEVVLAAAVRAYIPLIDPHGAWAPADEVATIYDRDLELAPPARLWASATRTAAGVRIDGGAAAPLLDGDVVAEVDGVTLAGLSAEAIEQLSEADEAAPTDARRVRLLRGERWMSLEARPPLADEAPQEGGLDVTAVRFGEGAALVVRIPDVPDGLGDELARALSRGRLTERRKVVGVMLDLRGNGGGSIDGATGALGLFLPGAPLFPLRHRDAAIETERAAEPPAEDRWPLAVAALVDGGTASAAEMIAGGLHAYRRGLVIGTPTYGKGCAQEYLDDAAASGVLRMTTLLYALPDGTAVQRIGLRPDIALPLPPPAMVHDRESDLPRAAPSWSGPDVRDVKQIGEVPWPTAATIGPCQDEIVCRALRSVASSHPSARRGGAR